MKTKKVVNTDGLSAFPTSAVAQLFWPLQAWKSSGLVVILDDDSIDDHVTGTILSNLQLVTPIRVKYETKPPENTTCGNWRREGYSRQQSSIVMRCSRRQVSQLTVYRRLLEKV